MCVFCEESDLLSRSEITPIISRYHVDIIQRAHFIFTEEQYIENIFGSFKENTNVYYFYF